MRRYDGWKYLILPICMVLLGLALSFVSCKKSDFEKVAHGIETVDITIKGLKNVIIEGNLRGMISTDDSRTILLACLKILDANDQASKLTRQLHQLNQQDKINLFQVIHPVLDTVDEIMKMDLINIKDPDTKNKIKMAIGLMQITLRGIEAALVGGANGNEQTKNYNGVGFRHDGTGQCRTSSSYGVGHEAYAL